MDEMLVCAMQRKGHPMTAGEVLDEAVGLAMSARWPKRAWTGLSAQKAFQRLKKLQDNGLVQRKGTKIEDGNERPLWIPVGAYNVKAELPEWSEEAAPAKTHKLAKLSREQIFVVFDVMEELGEVMARQRRDVQDLLNRQMDEFSNVMARAKRELALNNIDGGAF